MEERKERCIRCEKMRVGDLKHGFGNPRKITKKKAEELERSLEMFGDFGIFLIDESDNVIAGNQRSIILTIAKMDDERRLAFGWASVAIRVDGEQIEDWQNDMIDPEDLESAAYNFVELYREGGEMHEKGDVAVLIESVVFTEEKQEAIGIPPGTLPVGWWIGFHVTDPEVWEKVKNGEYSMFSIGGEAERVEI